MIDSLFLYFAFFIGIIIAVFQDITRREIDNWLNFSLIIVGLSYFFLGWLLHGELMFLLQSLVLLGLGFVFMNVLYYSHVFAGGDAKLLWGLSVFFVSGAYWVGVIKLSMFVILLLVCGGVYGLVYSLVLFYLHFDRCRLRFAVYFSVIYGWWLLGLGSFFLVLSSVWSFALLIGGLSVLSALLFPFARSLDDVVMRRSISGSDVRVGDWLVSDVCVGRTLISSRFDGVTPQELLLLKRLRHVEIRDGIPFAPAFLLAWVVLFFYGDLLFSWMTNLFVYFL